MKETKSKYRVGFVLQSAQCLSCDFHHIDHDSTNFYELKEEIFKIAEGLHDEMQDMWKLGCPKRELVIRFGNAVREIV